MEHIEVVKRADHSILRRELDIRSENTNIIILGQLYRPKGVHLLVKAFSSIAQDRADVRLYIVGDHVIEEYRAYKEELVAMIRESSLQEKVTFTGWRPDALEILATMDAVSYTHLTLPTILLV